MFRNNLILISFLLIFYLIQHTNSKEREDQNNLNAIQNKIKKIFQTKTDFFPDEGVIRINFPRTDIKVTIKEWPLNPFMGLSSWIGFQRGIKKNIEIMAMGDLVLLEDEVNTAISVALNNNIKVTALHNHFFWDKPKIYFMHLEAEGSVNTVATSILEIMNSIKNLPQQEKIKLPENNAIEGSEIEKIIGVKGIAQNGMFKIVIGRQIKAGCGCTVGKNMGINTWAAFGGTDENAIVCGDFAMLEHELQAVLAALRAGNINIVAIHNHVINESPRMLFVHFWGQGKASELAGTIKNAIADTHILASKKPK